MNTIDRIKINGVSYEMNTNHLDPFDIKWGRMTHVSVKKDGTGDYTSIQEAINSITDATENNQYCIDVHDDFYITDLTDLYLCATPDIHAPSSPTASVAVFTTKDYIHVRGVNGRRKITLIPSNKNLAGSCFAYIQIVNLKGNAIIEGIDFTLAGGRYAIHQESAGNPSSPDVNATTVIRNSVIAHLGNDDYTNGSSWTAVHAQANGTASGATYVFENVRWHAKTVPFYFHGNSDSVTKDGVEIAPQIYFINCSCSTWGSVSNSVIGMGNLSSGGNGEKGLISMVGCSFHCFNLQNKASGKEVNLNTKCNEYECGGFDLVGHSNSMSLVQENKPETLSFKIAENGYNLTLSGTAKDIIYGDDLARIDGTSDSNNVIWGKLRLQDSTIYALGKRLGNCVSSNKELVLDIEDSEGETTSATITLDADYTNSSNATVIEAINSKISALELPITITASIAENIVELVTFDDNKEFFSNNSESSFELGTIVSKTVVGNTMAFKVCESGESPYGVIGKRVNLKDASTINSTYIVKLDNVIFKATSLRVNQLPSQSGIYYSLGTGGTLVMGNKTKTSSSLFVSVGAGVNSLLIKI